MVEFLLLSCNRRAKEEKKYNRSFISIGFFDARDITMICNNDKSMYFWAQSESL